MKSYSSSLFPQIDQNRISQIYDDMVQKMQLLDKLNRSYKQKQETHFLVTFMHVVDKMGKELILAQEAYKNVDLEVKKDIYCVQLAEELIYYRDESLNLRQLLTKTQEELRQANIQKTTAQAEIKYTLDLYAKKTQECMELKTEIQALKKHIKSLEKTNRNLQNLQANRKGSVSKLGGINQTIESAKNPENHKMVLTERQMLSTALSPRKVNDSFTLGCQTTSKFNRNSLSLTPVRSQKKSVNPKNQTYSSTKQSYQSRRLIHPDRRILPEEYIPDFSN